jgi:hypothetical protein
MEQPTAGHAGRLLWSHRAERAALRVGVPNRRGSAELHAGFALQLHDRRLGALGIADPVARASRSCAISETTCWTPSWRSRSMAPTLGAPHQRDRGDRLGVRVERDRGRTGRLRADRLAGRQPQQHARRPLQGKTLAERLGDRRGGFGRVERLREAAAEARQNLVPPGLEASGRAARRRPPHSIRFSAPRRRAGLTRRRRR